MRRSTVTAQLVDPGADPRPTSVTRAVVQFVVAGLVAVAVFFVGTFFVIRDLGRRDALRNARQYATLAGQGIVEPALDRRALAGDPRARARIDRIVQERILNEGVVRVKIWDAGGRIVYSDEPRLIGDATTWAATRPRRSGPAMRRPISAISIGPRTASSASSVRCTRSTRASARPTERRSSSRRTSAPAH